MGNIGNRHRQSITFIQSPDGHGIIEIPGRLAIYRDKVDGAQVLAPGQLALFDPGGDFAGFCQDRGGKFIWQVELDGCDPDFNIRVSGVAEHLPDPPDSPTGSSGITLDLDQDHLLRPDIKVSPGGHQKSVMKTRVSGQDKTDAVFNPVTPDDQPVHPQKWSSPPTLKRITILNMVRHG